ncbi:MAG TPA: hypothetical protein VIV60_21995, partial [Polyangiaceae bacterium]
MLTQLSLVRLLPALMLIASCMACAEPGASPENTTRTNARPSRVPVAITAKKAQSPDEITAVLAGSVHAKLDCSDCHKPEAAGAKSTVLDRTRPGAARCEHCHEAAAATYHESVHAILEQGSRASAICADCHGDHDVLKVDDARSRVAKRNLASTCAGCHESPDAAPRLRAASVHAGTHYLESIHGRALNEQGLLVAPSCTDCHEKAHALRSPHDPESRVSAEHQADACGKCHAGVRDDYLSSVHYAARQQHNDKAPTCTSCHTAHDIAAANRDFRLESDKVCGKCHAKRRDQYLDTYHGRAHHLGDTRVAACYDCHAAHSINRANDPRSTVHPSQRVTTCRKCHADASESFASFAPHADHTDKQHYPVLYWAYWAMTSLLLGTFAFFGVHTLLWFTRSVIAKATERGHGNEPLTSEVIGANARLYRRFRPVDRFVHLLVIVSFLTLVATGMPLKFHSASWAQALLSVFGGVRAAGVLHRIAACLTLGYFVIHLLSLMGPIRRRYREGEFSDPKGKFSPVRFLGFFFGPDSPVPNLQDVRDFTAHVKWFFGKGPRPSFDRFTYWEKFDYMAVFWGVTVIGLSGLVMWFPVGVSRVIPGWLINVAHIVHSDEALLAAGFIFTF